MPQLRKQLPPLTATVIFEAAARLLSFTRAAQELNITQAAVSRQMRHLEEHFGKLLFNRVANGLSLTTAGEVFYRDIEDPLIKIANSANRIRRQLHENEISVSSTIGFAELWLTPRLIEFHQQHPEIKVRLLATDSDIKHIEFVVDAMFSIDYGSNVNRSNKISLCDEIVYPVCSPDYLRDIKKLSEPENLIDASLISIAAEHWINISDKPTTWLSWFASCGVSVDEISSAFSYSNDASTVQAALRGQGVTLGWHHLVRDHIESGQLVKLTNHVLTSGRKFCLFKSNTQSTTALVLFERWILSRYPECN
jgi:LysR family glycine cleavage system transcriptional activator